MIECLLDAGASDEGMSRVIFTEIRGPMWGPDMSVVRGEVYALFSKRRIVRGKQTKAARADGE